MPSWLTLPLTLVYLISIAGYTTAQTASPPGQPSQSSYIGQYEIVGNSLVSAQQLFLGTLNKVYIIDKTENNPPQINGHPAWAAEYDINANTGRPMDIVTNTFCAGGNVLGNGTWLNVGGNQAVTYGGLTANDQNGALPYDDPDGGQSVRLLNPCDDSSCNWVLDVEMTTRRWYPTLETLVDGTIMILGGCQFGGYVNDASQTNPTYEFFPSQGNPIASPILQTTLPVNLYPLTWLLPSGNLLIQSNWATVVLNYQTNVETPLDNIPSAVRTYPASAGTAMLPLTPGNNWTATIMFCGGTDLSSDRWNTNWNIAANPTSTSCVQLTPDVSRSYTHVDPLPTGRSMGNLILLPNGLILCLNGANTGTAGYGNTTWAIGQSFADNPVYQPLIYNPAAPAGQQWSQESLSASTIPRMYHSSATLLPDGSVLVSGSNPNADYNVGADVTYPTEYRVERFYPSYYNDRRPQPQGLLEQLSYGGPSFDVSLSADDLFGNVQNVQNASVIVLRTGFSTHTMNMGQRFVQLNSTYTGYAGNNTAILHVSQLPPNPAILAPGPALLFVVVNGSPSVGVAVMVGSGQLGTQPMLAVADLPVSSIQQPVNTNPGSNKKSDATADTAHIGDLSLWLIVLGVITTFCI
jgi:hypothetical protein